ncbi:MAG: alpha/beta hydrolase [Blastomonas sp.]
MTRTGPGLRIALLALLAVACSGGSKGEAPMAQPIMQWPDLLNQPRPGPDHTIRYGDDPLQLVDIWVPQGPLPHRAVIMIHGGCWQTDIAERDIMNYIADDLRKSGIGVWNIEYRGVDRPGGGYPGTYHDVGQAADLFLEKGPDYGFSTRRIVTIGHSAGGHLALWLAQRPKLMQTSDIRGDNPVRPDAAISQGGLPDLREGTKRTGHPCGTDAPGLMGGGRYAETSPPEMPVSDAAQYLFNTDRDPVAPPAYADAYKARMAAKGVTVETMVHGPEGHVELIAPKSKSWAAQKKLIIALLEDERDPAQQAD